MCIKNMEAEMKERFKKIKTSSKGKGNAVQVFKTPNFMNNIYDVCMVMENGLFIRKDHSCTMLYKMVQDSVFKKDCATKFFEVLRSYDFEYRFFYYEMDDAYLEVFIKPENQNKLTDIELAKQIEHIEQDMFLKLSKCGITLTAVWLDERLRLIHKRICRYYDAADKNIMNYQKDVAAWKEDITLKAYIPDENTLQIGDYRIKMAFIREFSQTRIKECIQQLLSIEDIECVMIQYSPIGDDCLKAFFHSNYMGCDNELRKLQTKNPVLYKMLSDNTLSDTRTYCFMGISILYIQKDSINGTTSNKESHNVLIKEQSNFGIDGYGATISDYQTNPIRTFTEFIPLGEWNYNQCRLFLNEDIKNTIPIMNQNPLAIQEDYSTSNLNEFFM